MKIRAYILLALIILPVSFLQAQLTLGIKSGYTKAWQDYGDVVLPDEAETSVKRLNISTQVYRQIGKFLSLGIEPGYSERGAACEPGFIGPFVGDTRLLLNYVEAPLMLEGRFPFFKTKLEAYAKIGYGVSLLVSAEREAPQIDGPVTRNPVALGPDSNLNRWDHGMYHALGFAYPFGANRVFVEANVYAGLRDAERFNASQNRMIRLQLGLSRELF